MTTAGMFVISYFLRGDRAVISGVLWDLTRWTLAPSSRSSSAWVP